MRPWAVVALILPLAGCIGGDAAPTPDWSPPELPDDGDPSVVQEFHADLLGPQPLNCYLWPSAWPPEYQADVSTPTLQAFEIPAEWSGLRFRVEWGDTGEELDHYRMMFESYGPVVPGAFWVYGQHDPGSVFEWGIPEKGPWTLWIWHCAGGRGEATFTVFDEVFERAL